MTPLREVISDLIVGAWGDETPTASLMYLDDLMARIEREKAEAVASVRPPDAADAIDNLMSIDHECDYANDIETCPVCAWDAAVRRCSEIIASPAPRPRVEVSEAGWEHDLIVTRAELEDARRDLFIERTKRTELVEAGIDAALAFVAQPAPTREAITALRKNVAMLHSFVHSGEPCDEHSHERVEAAIRKADAILAAQPEPTHG